MDLLRCSIDVLSLPSVRHSIDIYSTDIQTALICIYLTHSHYCKVPQVSSPPLLLDCLLAGFRSGLIFVAFFASFVH